MRRVAIYCWLLILPLLLSTCATPAMDGPLGARLANAAGTTAPYVSAIHVGPHPLAVAVDERTHHIFVAMDGAEGQDELPAGPGSVTMLDARGHILTTTRVGIYPEAIAVDAAHQQAFVLNVGPPDANGSLPAGSGTVSILDTKTGALVQTVQVGVVNLVTGYGFPSVPALAVDVPARRIYVLTQGTYNPSNQRQVGAGVDVLDMDTGRRLRSVPLPLQVVPQAIAVDAAAGRVIVTDPNGIALLDATSGHILSTSDLGNNEGGACGAVAIDAHIHRALVVLPGGRGDYPMNRLAILDTTSGALLHTMHLDEASCGRNAVDQANDRAFVISSDGWLVSSIDLRTGALLYTTGQGYPAYSEPVAVAVDPLRHRVYVSTETWPQLPPGPPGHPLDVKNVRVLDERTGAILDTVNVGSRPEALAVDEATGRVFVANRGDDTVSMIDPT